MKKMRKPIAVILALTLVIALLPMSASAANEYGITYSCNDSAYGTVRGFDHQTSASPGTEVSILAIPNEGCFIESVTVRNVANGQTVANRLKSFVFGGEVYVFDMPAGNVAVNVVFRVDNDNGYYTVSVNYIGSGTATVKRKGFFAGGAKFCAQSDDALLFNNTVPDDGYAFRDTSYYTTADGSRVNVTEGDPFSMPACDITLNIVFEKTYDIAVVTSGGTAYAAMWSWMLIDKDEITAAAPDDYVTVFTTPDENHLSDCSVRIVGASGETLDFSRGLFSMPAEDVTVYVTFPKASYDITCSAENGTLTSSPQSAEPGQRITLTAETGEGNGIREFYYTYIPEIGMDAVRVDLDPDGDHSFTMPAADVEVKAVFAKICHVEWLNGDGSMLDMQTYLEGGELPTTNMIPVKASTWECDYAFAGWSNPYYYTNGLVVFRPIFDEVYTVNIGSGTAQPNKAKAGKTITLTPDAAPEGMYFAGWHADEDDVEFSGNTFIMPSHHVNIGAVYELKKTPELSIDFADEEATGYTGKPFSLSGSVHEGGTVLNVGGTMTITFSGGAPAAEGAVSYTVPVEEGVYSLDIAALPASGQYVYAAYSGDGIYGEALVSTTINLIRVKGAYLNIDLGVYDVKQTYTAGEALDTANLTIVIDWTNGTEEELPVTPDMVSGFDTTTVGVQTLTVACPYPTDSELTYEVTVVSDGVGERLAGHTLSLAGDIGVNFYMELAASVASDPDAYMQFNVPTASGYDVQIVYVNAQDDGSKPYAETDSIDGRTYHIFKCRVAAKEMTSKIKAQIICGEKSGRVYTYSVKEYADYLLAHSEVAEYAAAAELVKAMLNYGAASQRYFGRNTDDLANAALSAEDQTPGEVTADMIAKPYVSAGTTLPGSVKLNSITLSLKSETTLSLYFESDIDLSFACEGRTVEKAVVNGCQTARIRGVKAKELGNDFTLSVTGEGVDGSVVYSPMTYCYNVLNRNTADDNLKNVVTAMYHYWQAAAAYFPD